MNYSDICKIRESVRGYLPAPVPAVLIPIGYSASDGVRAKVRKDMSEIVEVL